MPNAQEVFATFERSQYGDDWSGDVVYPFWGGMELDTIIVNDDKLAFPTRRQMQLLDKLLGYPKDIRPEVESLLFEHYQSDIYESVMELGSIDESEELTPKIESPEQIWGILGEPSVRIHFITDDDPEEGVRVRLTYIDCPWDHEHGFGIQLQDWKVEGFGGEVA